MIVSYAPMRICFWSQKTKGLSHAIPVCGRAWGVWKVPPVFVFQSAWGKTNPHVCDNVRIQHGHSTKKCKFHGFKPFGLSNKFPVYPISISTGVGYIFPFLLLSRSPWLVPYNFGFLQGSGFLTR